MPMSMPMPAARALSAILFAATLLSSSAARAQVSAPETSVGAVLQSLTARAAIVFAGQVVRIELPSGIGRTNSPEPSNGGSPGTVAITFAVTQPILCACGVTYVLHEWGGLWSAGQQRYHLGERALVFLHPANAAGISSPVDGLDGVVPLVVTTADAPPLADVRRLAARVQRQPGASLPPAETAAMQLPALAAFVRQTAATPTLTLLEPARQPLPPGAAPTPIAPITFDVPASGTTARPPDAR